MGRGWGADLLHIRHIPGTPYALTTTVYALFISSIFLTAFATGLYSWNLTDHMDGPKRAGYSELRRAQGISIAIAVLVFMAVLTWIISQTEKNYCDANALVREFLYHDGLVLAVFIGFLFMDIYTIKGLRKSIDSYDVGDERRAELCDHLEWAKAQLFVVDLAVIAGVVLLFFFVLAVHGASSLMEFTGPAVITPVPCGAGTVEVPKMVGSIFAAGVGTGALAAQILVSQIVFISLPMFLRLLKDDGRTSALARVNSAGCG
jgi:hypothetical protein